MFWSIALSIARRSRGFIDASPPPMRAATVISRMRRVKILPRFASVAAFLCLMFAHLLWPAMVAPVVPKERADDYNCARSRAIRCASMKRCSAASRASASFDFEEALLHRQRQGEELGEPAADPRRVVERPLAGNVLRPDARGKKLEELRERTPFGGHRNEAARAPSAATSATTRPSGMSSCARTAKRASPTAATCRMPSCGMSHALNAREGPDRRELRRAPRHRESPLPRPA